MWVYYQGDKPANAAANPDLENSGFDITVLDKNGINITERITNSAQTSGGSGGDALQFFVKTFVDEEPTDVPDGMDDDGVDGEEITVRVTGLRSLEETFKAPPATSQTNPLEGSN